MDFEQAYMHKARKAMVLTIVIMLIAVVVAFFSIFIIHFTGLTTDVIWDVLCAHFQGHDYGVYYYDLIVWEYTVPRSILAIVAGAGLAIGGAVMQSLMRNPLADPYTTGVASGASFGAALFFIAGFSFIPMGSSALNVTVNASLMALVPTVVIVLISNKKSITPTTMILAGIAIMYSFRAATSLMTLSADPENVEQLYMWNVGTVGSGRWSNLAIITPIVVVGSAIVLFLSSKITIMTAGDRCAKTMGVRTKLVRVISMALIAIITATIVGYTGTIGFLGLVAPHVARMIVGSNLKFLIPCSAAVGSLILIVCDCIARWIFYSGLHVGVFTSIIGGPIFIILLIKGARKVWY